MRERMKKEDPKMVMGDFMKMVSIEWTRLSQEEKRRYERMVEKDRQRWDNEYRQYKRNLQIAEEDEIFNYGRRYG
jgi:hypothetical protein